MKKPGEMALIGLMLMFFLLIAIYVFNFAFDAKNLPDFAKRNEEAINLAVITVAGFSVLLMIIGVFGLFFQKHSNSATAIYAFRES
ncbi:hypothetical protein [Rhodoferax sp.]|uniref:hypothetical protein n=1 Tax=Rhodoferax sp. TaxID=50421 RepID=UPI002ACDA361|nr:hypothetical protein [Rhodoferax sp.]MDZ7921682.1 hypothetical protein [Rhodoferax sp.]